MYYANRNYNESIKQLSKIIKIAPRLADSYLILGRIYEDCQDPVKAIQFYSLAAIYTPKPFELSKKIAFLAVEHNQFQQALAYTYKALKQNPVDLELLLLRIHAKMEIHDFRGVDTYIQLLLENHVNMYYLYMEYGERCQSLGYIDTAINFFKKYMYAIFNKHHFMVNTNDNTTNNSTNNDIEVATPINSYQTSNFMVLDITSSVQEIPSCFYACRRAVDLLLDKQQPSILVSNSTIVPPSSTSEPAAVAVVQANNINITDSSNYDGINMNMNNDINNITSSSSANTNLNQPADSAMESATANINNIKSNSSPEKGYILIQQCIQFMNLLKEYIKNQSLTAVSTNNNNNNNNNNDEMFITNTIYEEYMSQLVLPLDIHILEILCLIRLHKHKYKFIVNSIANNNTNINTNTNSSNNIILQQQLVSTESEIEKGFLLLKPVSFGFINRFNNNTSNINTNNMNTNISAANSELNNNDNDTINATTTTTTYTTTESIIAPLAPSQQQQQAQQNIFSMNLEIINNDNEYFELEIFFIRQLIRISEDYFDSGRSTLANKTIHTAVESVEQIVSSLNAYIENQQLSLDVSNTNVNANVNANSNNNNQSNIVNNNVSSNDDITNNNNINNTNNTTNNIKLAEEDISTRKTLCTQIYRQIGLFYETKFRQIDSALDMYLKSLKISPEGDSHSLLLFVQLVQQQDMALRTDMNTAMVSNNDNSNNNTNTNNIAINNANNNDNTVTSQQQEQQHIIKLNNMNQLHEIVKELLAGYLPCLLSHFLQKQSSYNNNNNNNNNSWRNSRYNKVQLSLTSMQLSDSSDNTNGINNSNNNTNTRSSDDNTNNNDNDNNDTNNIQSSSSSSSSSQYIITTPLLEDDMNNFMNDVSLSVTAAEEENRLILQAEDDDEEAFQLVESLQLHADHINNNNSGNNNNNNNNSSSSSNNTSNNNNNNNNNSNNNVMEVETTINDISTTTVNSSNTKDIDTATITNTKGLDTKEVIITKQKAPRKTYTLLSIPHFHTNYDDTNNNNNTNDNDNNGNNTQEVIAQDFKTLSRKRINEELL